MRDSVRARQDPTTLVHDPTLALTRGSELLYEYLQLTKPRIALLIIISTAVGFCFGITSNLNLFTLFTNALFGTALMAAGSATLNQWYERDVDAKMHRTRRRPIPAGTISADSALCFGVVFRFWGRLNCGCSRTTLQRL